MEFIFCLSWTHGKENYIDLVPTTLQTGQAYYNYFRIHNSHTLRIRYKQNK